MNHFFSEKLKMFLFRLSQLIKRGRYQKYRIGKGCYRYPKIVDWGEGATCQIGAFCSFGPDVKIYTGGEHRVDWTTTYPFNVLWRSGKDISGHPKTKGDVIIGNDVWVGGEAMIMSGVQIGDGAVIGARSLVNKNIPPYTIAAGNPAINIKKRFPEEIINSLLEIRWWEWDDNKIAKHLPLLLNDNIEEFIHSVKFKKI